MRCKRVFSTPTGEGAYVPAASWMNKPTADWPVYNVRRAQHSRFAWTQQSLWVVIMAGPQYAWRTIFNFVCSFINIVHMCPQDRTLQRGVG